ncbi:E3 ubiquitin-protein ligase TRIM39-like [Rhinoraja longicauda]
MIIHRERSGRTNLNDVLQLTAPARCVMAARRSAQARARAGEDKEEEEGEGGGGGRTISSTVSVTASHDNNYDTDYNYNTTSPAPICRMNVFRWTDIKQQYQRNIHFTLYSNKEETRQKRRISDEGYTLSVADGALDIGKFHHPFLLNTVISELSDRIKRVSVTLDVETAHAQLEVSEDRKRVRRTGTRRSLPDTGKRFTTSPCVLGSEGFTSGRHYWEVEVAGSWRWSLGVAAESVERKGLDTLTPENGVWRIRRWDDEFVAFTSSPSRLPARPIPGRVGVYLSYESGTVSFYDADTKSHLHTFTGNKFTEKLYPFFETWKVDQWLRICSGSAPGV